MAKRPPPGAGWRVLAWTHDGQPCVDLHSSHLPPALSDVRADCISVPTRFDEFVMAWPYIHIEQMDDRVWLVVLGDYRLFVTAAKGGQTVVRHEGKELSEYGLEKDW